MDCSLGASLQIDQRPILIIISCGILQFDLHFMYDFFEGFLLDVRYHVEENSIYHLFL